jgi:PhnB protein
VPTSVQLHPHLVVSDGAAAIEFYKKAFGATEAVRHAAPDSGKLMHATLELDGNIFYLNDDFPEHLGGRSRTPQAFGGTPVTLHLEVPDAQSVWDRAVAAGATVAFPLKEQFWGAIYGKLLDPFGHEWSIGQTVKTPSSEELEKGAKAAFQ